MAWVWILTIAIERLGATAVFVGLVATQIVGGLVWDIAVEGQTIGTAKWVGAGLAMVGALVMSRG